MHKFLLFIFLSVVLFAETPIFVLHSYHQDYSWTQKQDTGFTSVLNNKEGFGPLYSTEYLDTKRRDYDNDYEEEFVHYISSKYKGYQPELIYVTDDNALNFMLQHREKFFSSVPIIFSGINDVSKQKTLDEKIFTGVFENKDIISNIKLIKTLFPQENEILLLGDASTTSSVIQDEIKHNMPDVSGLKIHDIHNQIFESVLNKLKEFKGKVIILTTIGGFKTKEGQLVPLKQVIHSIITAGDFVVISLEDTYIQQGVIGGRVNDGMGQGQYAGKMALQILANPESPHPKTNKNVNSWIFDVEALEQHEIVLPKEILKKSRLLNTPKTFFQEHQEHLIILLYVLIIIIVLSSLYFTYYMYRSKKIILQREESLSNITESMQNAQAIAHLGNWDWNIKTNHLWWSDEIYRIFGLQSQEFKATIEAFLDRVHPDDQDKVQEAIYHTLDQKTDYRIEHRIVKKDGTERYVLEEGNLKLDAHGDPLRMTGIVQDITEVKVAQKAVEKLSKVVEQIDDLVLIANLKGNITYVNQAFCDHAGYTREEVLGKTPRMLKSDQYDENFYKDLWKTILQGTVYRETVINKKKNGDLYYEKKTITPLRDDKDNLIGFVSSGKDVTLETMMHQEIEHIASTDKLTGLHNRHKFEELFILEAERSRRFVLPLSLILIDVDHFKSINDTYGHDIGDNVLKDLANAVQDNIRKLDIFARWGGEEFLILTPNTNHDNVQIVAEKLRVFIENHHFPKVKNLTVSLGISTLKETDTFTELFKRADQGLYYAKENGRNKVGIN
ncbi:MAG: diguanylate cyclase [Sulfurovum sp.]|nr:diguanylate cyclase [Sulfurovum sp.]